MEFRGEIIFVGGTKKNRETQRKNFEEIADWYTVALEFFSNEAIIGDPDWDATIIRVYAYQPGPGYQLIWSEDITS